MEFDIKDLEWKPIMSREITLYDRLGREFNAHPMIIFVYQDKVYFLKSQSAIEKPNKEDYEIITQPNEILRDKKIIVKGLNLIDEHKELISKNQACLVTPYEYQPKLVNKDYKIYFTRDSLIDTSQIFVMNKNDFVDYFGSKALLKKINDYTRTLRYKDQERIVEQLVNNLRSGNFSLTEIYKENTNKFDKKSIYNNPKLVKEEKDKLIQKINKGYKVDLDAIDAYLKAGQKYYENNKTNIEKEIQLLIDYLYINVRDQINGMIGYILEQTPDLEFYDWDNQKLNYKYTIDEINDMYLLDLDKKDELLNLSRVELKFYDEHPGKWQEDFDNAEVNYKNLEQEVEEFKQKQKETNKKDRDQEMTL
ncbi:MAG: hypothetical protein IIT78_01800 [Mycoplasmataceae bacterium]|nr:hypothetical protein [Mycoplasmataceae bacterium]